MPHENARSRNYRMVKRRRPAALAVAILGLICATLSVIHVFDIADIPGGAFLGIATVIFLTATWILL